AFTLYIKGVQMSPLSLTVPMLSLTTIFTIVTQFYIDGIIPTPIGVIGIILIVCGIYVLHFDHDTKHILSPFKAIFKEKGVLLVTVAAILWSFVTAFQKLGIDNSNPYFYTAFFQLFWAICFTPVAFLADRKAFINLFKPKMVKKLFPAGAFDAVQVFPQYIAFSLAAPAYVYAIGNTQILFSSFFGWLFYKEKLKNHVIPTIIIVVGVILVTLAQI
ncbi:MAG TPA: EamA family transporter, partial [Candidatus Saccharimonadales bacterium]|nr:EamA family transporter [Candidatus Saccharimonadales bacterium]